MQPRRLLVAAILVGLIAFVAQVIAAPEAKTAQPNTLLTIMPPPEPPLPAPHFADVDASHPYYMAISAMGAYGFMIGYDDGTFGPEDPVLRAQLAKVMCLMHDAWWGSSVNEDTPYPFTDLGPDDPESLYPHEYAGGAAVAGLMGGYPDGTFRPYQDISRAQVVSVAVRADPRHSHFGLPDVDPPPGYQSAVGDFDATHGPNMATAEYRGLLDGLQGYGPSWDPWAKMTRGEIAQVLWNLMWRPIPKDMEAAAAARLGSGWSSSSTLPVLGSPTAGY